MSPAKARDLAVVATGRLDQAEFLLREMFARGVGLNTASQLVEVLLADWNLRAHPGTLTDGLAVAREGIRRASHLDDAVRSGALTDEDVQNALGQKLSSRWPGYWQPDLRIRRKRTRPRPPPRPSVPHANALSDSS